MITTTVNAVIATPMMQAPSHDGLALPWFTPATGQVHLLGARAKGPTESPKAAEAAGPDAGKCGVVQEGARARTVAIWGDLAKVLLRDGGWSAGMCNGAGMTAL